MNEDLIQLIKKYATASHDTLITLLHSKSKENIIGILTDLLTTYFNDKNSSSLREFVLVSFSGFIPIMEKIGYNGYRQSGMVNSFCEAKPVNINTNGKSKRKLNGGGNFTDYSWERFRKDKETNPKMLTGGFVDGKLIYIFQFSFNTRYFIDRLKIQLENHFPDGDITGKYLRSASFTFKHYNHAEDLKSNVFVPKKELCKYRDYVTKDVYDVLEQISK